MNFNCFLSYFNWVNTQIRSLIRVLCADKDSYPHDSRADKGRYRHDPRADKNPYRHDRHADSLSLSP